MVLCLRKGGVILAWEGMSFLLGYYTYIFASYYLGGYNIEVLNLFCIVINY